MFDLRYHVASLAAVFLALIIGILVGVGISDSGVVDSAKTKFLQDEVASLQRRLDNKSTQSADQARDRVAAQTFINETYPALARNRLKGKQIAVVFVGSDDKGGIRSSVSTALSDAGAQQVRLRALNVPVDVTQLDAALKSQPAAAGLRGKANLEALGRALGQELVLGGDTPLWDSLTGTTSLVQHRLGGSKMSADGVVVVRTASPQRGGTTKFLLGLYEGLGSTSAPAVGVEQTDAADSATAIFRRGGLSTVDDVDTRVGRLALVLLLAGQPGGQYGVKDSANDGALPPLPTRPATAGG
jgi:Copper transport outer membrane protein, MctB